MHTYRGKGRAAGRVGSGQTFVSNRRSGRVGSTFRRVESGPRKVTRGQLCVSIRKPWRAMLKLIHISLLDSNPSALWGSSVRFAVINIMYACLPATTFLSSACYSVLSLLSYRIICLLRCHWLRTQIKNFVEITARTMTDIRINIA